MICDRGSPSVLIPPEVGALRRMNVIRQMPMKAYPRTAPARTAGRGASPRAKADSGDLCGGGQVTMDEIDKEALTRALKLTKAEPERAGQIESMLENRSWEEVAQFAARHQQCKNLRLKPWETPPCHGAVKLRPGPTLMRVSQPRTVFCSACWTQASLSGSRILRRRLRPEHKVS